MKYLLLAPLLIAAVGASFLLPEPWGIIQAGIASFSLGTKVAFWWAEKVVKEALATQSSQK